MAWRIEVSDDARKQLKKIGHAEAKRIRDYLRKRIEPLDDPRDRGSQNEIVTVMVIRIGHRRHVYR